MSRVSNINMVDHREGSRETIDRRSKQQGRKVKQIRQKESQADGALSIHEDKTPENENQLDFTNKNTHIEEGESSSKYTHGTEERQCFQETVEKPTEAPREVNQAVSPRRNVMNHFARLTIQRNVKYIEKKKTVLSVLIPNRVIYDFVVVLYKHRFTSALISLFWFVCDINFISITYNDPLLPTHVYLPLQVMFTLNFVIHHSIYIRVDVVKELARSFNFWFTIWNLVSLHICSVFLWGSTINAFCGITHSFASILLLILFDAHAGKQKKLMKVIAAIGIFSMSPVLVVLLFQLVDFKTESFHYGPNNLEIINVRLLAVDNLVNLVVYLLRISYNHIILKSSSRIAFLSSFYETQGKLVNIPQNVRARNQINHDHDPDNFNSLPPSQVKERESHVRDMVNNTAPPGDRRNECIIATSINIPAEIDVDKHMIIGITESITVEYDLHETIFHRHIRGKHPILEKILKSKVYNICSLVGSLLSLLISLPLACGIETSREFHYLGIIISSLGIFFISLQTLTTCNFFLVRRMIHSFDYCFVMVLSLKTFVSSGMLCSWDSRMIFWIFEGLAFNWSIMIDTFHAKARRSAYVNIAGTVWMFTAAVLCKLNVGQTFSTDKFIQIKGVQPISSRMSLVSSLLSSCIFTVRFFWSYHKNKDRILFMTEHKKVEAITT